MAAVRNPMRLLLSDSPKVRSLKMSDFEAGTGWRIALLRVGEGLAEEEEEEEKASEGAVGLLVTAAG